jgi:hypothetical protein
VETKSFPNKEKGGSRNKCRPGRASCVCIHTYIHTYIHDTMGGQASTVVEKGLSHYDHFLASYVAGPSTTPGLLA